MDDTAKNHPVSLRDSIVEKLARMANEDGRNKSNFIAWLIFQEWERRHPEPQPEPQN